MILVPNFGLQLPNNQISALKCIGEGKSYKLKNEDQNCKFEFRGPNCKLD